MTYNCSVKVVDSIMGSGKTSAAVNYINQSENERILYITPFLDEIKRIKTLCEKKNFKEPEVYKTKLNGIKFLVQKGANITSTHALFHRFDEELVDMCRNQNYTLILDEVTSVIQPYEISKQDFETLITKYAYVDEKTNLIKWREDSRDYDGKFSEEKRLCDFDCLAYYGGAIMLWLFPVSVFNAFKKIYILTYKFKSQMQCYYYDFFKLPYSFAYVEGDSIENYRFTDNPVTNGINRNYKKLIHICQHEKLNSIGDLPTDLSMNWYKRNRDNVVMSTLKKNVYNFFNNIQGTKSKLNLWTTFSDYEKCLCGKGYGKGYLSHNSRSTNDFRDRISVAYLVNKFINVLIKKFFEQNGINVDEDGFALSEMLQFIWRSAIRDGKEIWVYIPSIRMRRLLEQWIEENSNIN